MAWIVGIGIALFLLFVFPKQMGIVILVVIGGAAALFGYLYLEDQRRAEEYRERKESITLEASYDLTKCSTEFPLLVEIRNGYTDTLQSLTFEINGYREGYSSPVYRGYSYKSDRIIAPGETYVACWTQPGLDYGARATPPQSLNWRATYSYASFGNEP